MQRSDRDLAVYHMVFGGVCLLVLWLPVQVASGPRVALLTGLYAVSLPIVGSLRGHSSWLPIWRFALVLSVFQVLPDRFLAEKLGVLVFPADGFPKFGAVSAYMAGLWTIPIVIAVYVGERCVELREGFVLGGTLAAALTATAIFVASEQVAPLIPIWHARGVSMLGNVALYVIGPEMLLGGFALHAFRQSRARALPVVIGWAALTSIVYTGALALSFLLVG